MCTSRPVLSGLTEQLCVAPLSNSGPKLKGEQLQSCACSYYKCVVDGLGLVQVRICMFLVSGCRA